MNRNDFMWILECCLLSLDNYTKEEMVEFGVPEKLAKAGIKLCSYLKEKDFHYSNEEIYEE